MACAPGSCCCHHEEDHHEADDHDHHVEHHHHDDVGDPALDTPVAIEPKGCCGAAPPIVERTAVS